MNDTLGHQSGDQYILEFTKTVKSNIKGRDTFYRIGGDEFIIIFDQTTLSHVDILLEKLQKQVQVNSKKFGDHKSFAYGCVSTDEIEDSDITGLVHMADLRMYENKKKIKSI